MTVRLPDQADTRNSIVKKPSSSKINHCSGCPRLGGDSGDGFDGCSWSVIGWRLGIETCGNPSVRVWPPGELSNAADVLERTQVFYALGAENSTANGQFGLGLTLSQHVRASATVVRLVESSSQIETCLLIREGPTSPLVGKLLDVKSNDLAHSFSFFEYQLGYLVAFLVPFSHRSVHFARLRRELIDASDRFRSK